MRGDAGDRAETEKFRVGEDARAERVDAESESWNVNRGGWEGGERCEEWRRVEYRAEKNSIVHAGIGKTSFEEDAIVENASCLMASVFAKQTERKGAPAMSNYIKRVYLSTTMSEGSRRIDPKELMKLAEEYNQRNTLMSSSPGGSNSLNADDVE